MTELLKFYPEGDILYVEFLANKYLEIQPKTAAEKEALKNRLIPVIEQVDNFVESNNLKEVIEVNLEGVSIASLDPKATVDMLNLCLEIRPVKYIVQKIVITNATPLFYILYNSIKSMLPERLTSVLEISDFSD
jgi:hypothetical protein